MSDQSIREFAEALGSKSPIPGGGGAACHTALFGASLARMLVEFTRGRKENGDQSAVFDAAEDRLWTVVRHLTPMADRDAAGFGHVAAAYALPKSTEGEKDIRTRAIQEALLGAMTVPEELVHMCRDGLLAVHSICSMVGRNLAGDAGTATALLSAAARSGELLVRSNASYLTDRDTAHAALARVDAVVQEVQRMRREIDRVVESQIDG